MLCAAYIEGSQSPAERGRDGGELPNKPMRQITRVPSWTIPLSCYSQHYCPYYSTASTFTPISILSSSSLFTWSISSDRNDPGPVHCALAAASSAAT
jgi:hypothetical protein